MEACQISQEEQYRRSEIVKQMKKMLASQLQIEAEDEQTLMTNYHDYYLQISFSELHPLMVFCLAKSLQKPSTMKQRLLTNELNLRSVLGSHSINDEVGCYSYRATHWLDVVLEPKRFFEMLDRCVDEADRGILKLAG
jgi:hypothetical protein